MRVEYKISEDKGGWLVERGATAPLRFDNLEAAVRVADHLAQSAAMNGDTGVVRVAGEPARSTFRPGAAHASRTRFDPERDGRERAERLAPMRI
ncbi:hypothetical protein ASE17_19760 [Phenylobacterium sp. Root77]|jgi:hypothetical protein|nr:hypothetical protein ASC73_17845 [Phenylobacterium sp. Root1277]KQW89687.1 hypothetical protein ASC79_18750 [Phenylobacterium sp. Root1290]KRC43445.1 hypothetical protein ASE17_19760 [Phenylobacterium sp. Root77]